MNERGINTKNNLINHYYKKKESKQFDSNKIRLYLFSRTPRSELVVFSIICFSFFRHFLFDFILITHTL